MDDQYPLYVFVFKGTCGVYIFEPKSSITLRPKGQGKHFVQVINDAQQYHNAHLRYNLMLLDM